MQSSFQHCFHPVCAGVCGIDGLLHCICFGLRSSELFKKTSKRKVDVQQAGESAAAMTSTCVAPFTPLNWKEMCSFGGISLSFPSVLCPLAAIADLPHEDPYHAVGANKMAF